MEWEVSWKVTANESEKRIEENGVVRGTGDYVIDALNTFFRNKDNRGRSLMGITQIYEPIPKRRQRFD